MKSFSCLITFALLAFFFSNVSPQLVRLPIKKTTRKDTQKSNRRFLSSLDINNFMNTRFTATVRIGSEGQKFNVILDTGSSIMWIPDSSLSHKVDNTYSCSTSSTCSPFPNTVIPIAYGKGEIEGYKIVDQVDLGGLVIPKYDMLLTTNIVDMQLEGFDGILGLGLGRIYFAAQFPTLLESLKANGLINTGTFSMYLGDDPTSLGDSTGEIIFGGHDPKYAASEFQFIKVHRAPQALYWSTNMMALGFGSEVNISDVSNFPIIFDSGTSLIMLSDNMLRNFFDQAALKGVRFTRNSELDTYKCSCTAQKTLSNLIFYFNGATVNISASSYIMPQGGYCVLGILSHKELSAARPVVLGDVFLKNFYALYTADNSTVGLAVAAPIWTFPIWLVNVVIICLIAVACLVTSLWNRYKNNTTPVSPGYSGKGIMIGGGAPAGKYFLNLATLPRSSNGLNDVESDVQKLNQGPQSNSLL